MKPFPAKSFIFVAGAVLCAACAQQPPQTGEIEYFRLSQPFSASVQDQPYRLSPDGSRLAMLEAHAEAVNIVVRELAGGRETRATDYERGGVSAFDWVSDKRLVYTTDHEAAVYAVNFDGSMHRMLNPPGEYLQLLHRVPSEPGHVLVAKPGHYSRAPDLFTLDVVSGRARLVAKGPPGEYPERWFVTRDGQPAAALLRKDAAPVLMRYDPARGEWLTVDWPGTAAWSTRPLAAPLRDSVGLAVSGGGTSAHRRPFELHRFDFDAGIPVERLFTIEGVECCELLVSPGTGELVSASAITGQQRRTVYANPDVERVAQRLGAGSEGRDVRFISLDREHTRGVAVVSSAVYDPDYYLVDMASGRAELLADSPPVLSALRARRASTRDIVVISSDRGLVFDMAATQLPGPLQSRQVDSVSSRSVGAGGGEQ